MIEKIKAFFLTLCGICMLGGMATFNAHAADNPFFASQSAAVQIAAAHDQKCAAGKCQAGKCKGAPAAKCQAGKCGGMSAERKTELQGMCAHKIRSGFCGAGKCGAGKCGDALKETCARIVEGKCGEAK